MPPDSNNGRKELGQLQGQMEGVQTSQTRMEGKIDRILDVLPKHEERLHGLERSRKNLVRFFVGVGICVASAIIIALILPK